MRKMLIPLLCLLVSTSIHSADNSRYRQFFDEYDRLLSEFDVSVKDLYADNARIMGARKKADGTEESMTIDGAQWKTIILASMERAKQLGDRSDYSDVVIDVDEDGDGAKISATKYSQLDCFQDDRFYMVVRTTADDQLEIVEQFSQSPMQSNCEESKTDLPAFLQTTVKMINEQLPAKIDAETQLIKTTAVGSQMTYHYLLINHTADTLSTQEASEKLRSVVIQQSCSSPNLRPILDQNGSLSYIYRGSDAAQIVKFDVDKSACSG